MKQTLLTQIKNSIPKSIKDNAYSIYYALLEINLSVKNFFLDTTYLVFWRVRELFNIRNHFFSLTILIIKVIRPLLVIRISWIRSDVIGHFAANTELYLCARDFGLNVPSQPYLDLWYYTGDPPRICNSQLDLMWRRTLLILPCSLLIPIERKFERQVSQGNLNANSHFIPPNGHRDINHLLDRCPSHLKFLPEEEEQGQAYLREMGIPSNAPFVCLIVRDSAYNKKSVPDRNWDYHNYRDCNIQNFVLAAEELGDRGYYVIRMGAAVNEKINTSHPKVIDYATNGMRTEFMDIYLGAKCTFCISTSTGFDAIPEIFRRPIVYTNVVPLGRCHTFSQRYLSITKTHWCCQKNRRLSLKEILAADLGNCTNTSEYESKSVTLIENSPQEVQAISLEMVERLERTWQSYQEDELLQQKFWNIFPKDIQDPALNYEYPLHGEMRARFGAEFLRQDPEWLT